MDKDTEEDEVIKVNNPSKDLFWKPEEFGFERITGDGLDRGSKWVKGKYTLTRLSITLWIMHKTIGYVDVTHDNGNVTKKAKLVTKWHMVIDNRDLAKLYFTAGLRG